MCQVCVGRIEQLTTRDLVIHEMRLAESQFAKRTIRRRKGKALDKPVAELVIELRRLYRRESDRVIDLLRSVKLPFKASVQEAEVRTPEELARLLLNGIDYSPYEAALLEAYRDIYPPAMIDVLEQVRRGVYDLRDFPQAQAWIKAHAIEFSKRWAPTVTETTNRALRDTLAKGWREFEGTQQLVERVKRVYAEASDVRAEMIARTESNRAYNAAQMEMGRELGVSKKFWISSGSPYALVDVCGENAARDLIGINEMFQDIDGMPIDAPPAHVNCLCDIGYEFADDWELPEQLFRR